MTETNYANSKDDLQPARCGECDQVIAGTLYCFNCIQVLKEKLLAPPSTSAAIRAAAEEIRAEVIERVRKTFDPKSTPSKQPLENVIATILSRYFGKGEAERSREVFDAGFATPAAPSPGEPLQELENELIQTAITAHCRADDSDAQDAFHAAASALIEARYQSVKFAAALRTSVEGESKCSE